MIFQRLLLFVLSVLSIASGAFACVQGTRHLNVSDGLSSRQVYKLSQDSIGYIWIYSNAGLDRFDGHRTRHYALDARRESIDHILWATTLMPDSTGAMWVAQMSGDLYRYDRAADRFVREYEFADSEARIYGFAFAGDRVLLGTNKGLYGLRRSASGDFEPELLALDGRLVTAIVRPEDGIIYAGTDAGVYAVDPSRGYSATLLPDSRRLYVKSLAVSDGQLYIGTFSRGVYSAPLSGGAVRQAFEGIPSLPVNALEPIGTDSLLVGIDGAGVYLVDSRHKRPLHRYTDDQNEGPSLSGNTITDVFADSGRGLWVATSHKGITYIPPSRHPAATLRADAQGRMSDYANAIHEDSHGDFWIGTDKGLNRYRRRSGQWENFLQNPDSTANVILNVCEDSDGRIWVGSYGNGVSIIDPAQGTARTLPLRRHGGNAGVATECVFAIARDANGEMWMGGINGDITRYDPATDSYRYYGEDCVSAIVPDAGGRLLFAGNMGIGRYNPATDAFEWTRRYDSIEVRYPARCVLDDPRNGRLWVGTTGDGLISFDKTTGSARRYTTADGLSSNSVYNIVQDNSGALWISTETELYRLDPDADRLAKLTFSSGDGRGSFNPNTGFRASDGAIVLGTADGCLVFYPEEEMALRPGREIHFTDFRQNDTSITPGAEGYSLRTNIDLTDRLVLAHDRNSFDLRFDILNYTSPRRIGFSYRLDGHDRRWQPAPDYEARYRDLPPGDYTFRVRAVDLYTGEELGTRSLDISVRPPLWLTWWAKIIYLLLSGALVAFLASYIRHYRREKKIEGQIESFAAVAHDIRTPISLIKSPLLNIEMEKDLSESVRSNLLQARSGIDKAMDMLGEMLELRTETRLGPHLRVRPLDLGEFLRVKAEEYAMLAKFKGLALETYVAPDMPKVCADPEILGHIVDNLLSNALKYTEKGTVRLMASPGPGKRWTLSVSDTGIGIAPEDARYIFRHRHRSAEAVAAERAGMGMGLLITRRLVATHRGRITFRSTPGEGTTFEVILPPDYPAKYHAAAGTPAAPAPEGEGGADTPAAESSRLRVYAVEDDPDMLEYLRKSLEPDYEVRTFGDSLAAFDAIRSDSPDLVITDRMMPRLRGDELCRMVKTDMATSHIPVIILSGLVSREDILAGFEAHADDYIAKPFDIVLLKARIRNILKTRAELSRRVIADDGAPVGEEFTNELDREFMARVNEAVEAHMADSEFSISGLCADLCMSRTSVYNKIKSLTGQSLNEYIRIMRLNRSRELLLSRRYNISEVAYMVGFSDPKYFSTCFKKQFGVSPSKV